MFESMPDVAKRILEAMATAKMNQAQLAEAVGTTPARVSDWKAGKSRPTIDQLANVAKVLGVSVDYLLGVSDEPRPDASTADMAVVAVLIRSLNLTTEEAVRRLARGSRADG